MGQYYQILQQQPDLVYQFYTNLSTTVHLDGSSEETASGMLVRFYYVVVLCVYYGTEILMISLDDWFMTLLSSYFIMKSFH